MLNLNLNLAQQVQRVLACPLGARVLQPKYGSKLHEFADQQATNLASLAIEVSSTIETNLNLEVEGLQVGRAENGFKLNIKLKEQSLLTVDV